MSTKYLQLLQKSSQQLKEEEASFQAQEAEATLELDLISTKRALSSAKRELETTKGEYPLNTKAIQAAKSRVENLEAGVKTLEELQTELFTEIKS